MIQDIAFLEEYDKVFFRNVPNPNFISINFSLYRKQPVGYLFGRHFQGKNTYRFYTDKLSLAQHREANLEKYLRDAIKKNELSLCYQPLYQLTTREIIGAEILLRWTHPILGEISPEEFIPVAEHNHFILKIGNWVVHQACAQAKLWAEKYQRHLSFAIKVSPLQLSNNHFCLHFKKTLEKLDYPGDPLIIEITERLLMNSHDKVASRLSTVRSLGIQIALDHYGRGYSSLSHLTALPINFLKIDKAFIAEITPDTEKALGVDAIIQLAHELNMTTLAEGIETQAQLKYLIEKQCPIGQGFYLSKPLTKEAFEALAY